VDPTRPQLPREVIEFYNLFIHGEVTRRDPVDGLQRFAVGDLTAGEPHASADA
jgi:hypothetical protein